MKNLENYGVQEYWIIDPTTSYYRAIFIDTQWIRFEIKIQLGRIEIPNHFELDFTNQNNFSCNIDAPIYEGYLSIKILTKNKKYYFKCKYKVKAKNDYVV